MSGQGVTHIFIHRFVGNFENHWQGFVGTLFDSDSSGDITGFFSANEIVPNPRFLICG